MPEGPDTEKLRDLLAFIQTKKTPIRGRPASATSSETEKLQVWQTESAHQKRSDLYGDHKRY